ncbi:Mis6-domain-containing protein [Viridothelium virens]|uniref:Mis6-domain-containing protein n=1 Tax=Viridothelium virens TaxID=1048519 RepID=A0A6A6H2J4_VIRVR|nr:Mis6-domain-containing protein [Viridothelium virens]
MPSFVQSDELADALQTLQDAASTPARQRISKVSTIVDAICSHAFNYGLNNAQLRLVLDVITKQSELDQTSITSLIKNLYPGQKVQNEAVTIVVGCLGQAQGKPSPTTQASLIKWLITVYEFIEDPTIISRLYTVLFGLLDMISLRPYLCHLLALATKRKHVRPSRMQQLLELVNSVGNEPALLSLATIYKDYYPEIILTGTIVGRAKPFTHPNPEWRERLHSIQQANLHDLSNVAPFQSGFKVVKHGAKRSKSEAIPQVHTLHAQELSVTLEEISNVNGFIDSLDRIDLPSQLIASLNDPLLQKYLSLRPSELASQRIRSWLLSYGLGDQAGLNDLSSAYKQEDILAGILSFASTTKTLPPGADMFIKRLIPKWDRMTPCTLLLDCLVLLPHHSFEGKVACAFARTRIKAIKQSADLLETIIKPVEAKLLAGHSITFTRMLHFYTDLARHLQLLVAAADDDAVQVIEHRIECFEQLAHHVLNLLPPILTTPQCSQSTTTAVIEFLEILATSLQYFHEISPSVFQQMPIILPQPHTIYILLFDTSVSDISHLCSILATYKGVLQKRRLTSTSLQQQTIDQFNGYLMDVCNLLWRSRAFGRGDINAMGCFLPESALPVFQDYLWNIDHEYGLPYIFGLSHHASLSLLSITALRELEDLAETRGEDLRLKHAGPVTQRSLMKLDKDGGFKITWRDYRVQVLDYLEKRSLGGIKELMFSTMKDLTPNAI